MRSLITRLTHCLRSYAVSLRAENDLTAAYNIAKLAYVNPSLGFSAFLCCEVETMDDPDMIGRTKLPTHGSKTMAKKATKPVTNVFLIVRDRRVSSSLASELKDAGYRAIDYQTAREFLIDKPNHKGGVVLSELRLLGMQGAELVEQLAGERANFPVVLIVNNADTPKAVKAGVDFMCGPLSAEILIAAIQRLKTPEEFSERDLKWFFNRLTPAESKVLDGVIAGKASRAIAAEIGISTKTVEAHRARINAKSRATDVGQLIRMWKAWQILQ
jgi:two-component system response regulator FixJ